MREREREGERGTEREGQRERDRERGTERERGDTLFLNGEDISTKADWHICRCYSTTNNRDIRNETV